MTDVLTARACPRCGAALPLEVASSGGKCAFCGVDVVGDPNLARAQRLVAEEKLKLQEDALKLEAEKLDLDARRQALTAQADAWRRIDQAVATSRRGSRTSFWIQVIVALLFLAALASRAVKWSALTSAQPARAIQGR